MLPGLLQKHGAEAFREKLDILKRNPELLEKILTESGASPEVANSFLTQLVRLEGPGVADAREAAGLAMGALESPPVRWTTGSVCGRGEELGTVVEELQQQVSALTQQVSALQRQLRMQGEVSQLAASLEGLVNKRERRTAESDETLLAEIRRVDGRISAVEQVLREEVLPKRERIDLKSDPLDGIIARLTRECGGNVHLEGIVKVTASSVHPLDTNKLEHVVDLKSDSLFFTTNSPNSWLRCDFKRWRVAPVSYSIRTFPDGPGGPHPKSWVLEVSNNGSEGTWNVVDSRNGNCDLNGGYVIHNFEIRCPPSRAFRFVRLRLTTKNHREDDFLALCAFELFGTLSHE